MPKKKPFIDKKKSVTFKLVHRSQRDPLAADEDAPQRVLVPMRGMGNVPDSVSESGYDYEVRLSTQKTHGIQFEDEYDYMQHLMPAARSETFFELKEESAVIGATEDGKTEILRDDESVLQLPSVVFGSTMEEPVGMLHRAIPPVGPQPQWDPDVVAGLDEDFNYDDPDNLLEDDFIAQASQPQEGDEEEVWSECSSDFSDEFAEEETKSRFTSYSMTSSVMRRNEQLSLLDDKFERFFESYDEAHIGDLAQVEIEGGFPVGDLDEFPAMKMLLGIEEQREENDPDDAPKGERHHYDVSADDVNDDDVIVPLVIEEPDKKWDCESILSTYSNLYNRPKLIEEPVKKIKVSEKTGMPVKTAPRLTSKELRALDPEPGNPPDSGRRRDESKEEKIARKRAVKEARKERRQEKKATKIAFKEERTRQTKEMLNIRQNLSGIRIN